jgi:hypothetical protein
MSWLRSLAVLLVLGATTVCCASDAPGTPAPGSSRDGDLCSSACAERVERGCVVDPAACTQTCLAARTAGYCSAELDAHLTCVVGAADLHCGRAPNGGSCDGEAVALEHCIAEHAVDDTPPDCYGNACTWQCGPIGKQLCAPGKAYLCECPSGASGEQRCAHDGCFWLPCSCSE